MYTNEGSKNLSEEDKKRSSHAIQLQIVMLESDNRKLINEQNILDAELRNFRMDEERLRVSLDEKQKRFVQVKSQIAQNEEELKRMRKKLNTL
jgi:chromosome segregation ATPase